MPVITSPWLDCAVAANCHVTPMNESASLDLNLFCWKSSRNIENLCEFVVVAVLMFAQKGDTS